MTQEQYWKELYQLRVHTTFIELKLEQSEWYDRLVKILLAIASSSSIGAWALWNDYSWIWAGIIAVSQVVGAINPFLPYKNRLKAYSSLINELEELMVRSEFRWHAISQGEMTPTEINKARFEIRSLKQKALKKHIQTTIPTDSKLHDKAEELANQYFATFY
ncbi:hypothetical protein WMY97_23510 [Vibrio diabolicus]|nr:hypothetical protein [Vibrio alginolyticus]EHJ9990638.1 hypothetical protein [Vibrio parahaemolyticus]EIZ1047690.1 hypothetical protein [Vibrio parahaemolyticus]HAS3030279.1 hypothetical protein [Vibrio parahaemolyticus]HAS3035561.1 hypothetical protein [Vibrio parahaemolyticus]HAS3040951.1 hypothetical protein [Vibrio parahaemolyticus]